MTTSTLQGSPELLRHETATGLLTSTELARLAYVARDGTPRVMPMLFHWTGTELVMATFAGEYAAAHRRYYGDEQGTANVAEMDRPGVRMARIALRPAWVGVLDFQTRFPGARPQ